MCVGLNQQLGSPCEWIRIPAWSLTCGPINLTSVAMEDWMSRA